jgi:uncharacterized membrane protein YqjE
VTDSTESPLTGGTAAPTVPTPSSLQVVRLVAAMLATRLALARADCAQALTLLKRAVWLSAIALIALALAAIFSSVAVLIYFWDTYRIAAAIALPSTFAVLAIGAALLSRRQLQIAPRAFDNSVDSWQADREALFKVIERQSP